jgi:hypothetical protein
VGETLTGPAKQDYESGRALFDKGDYTRALVKFRSAYTASGDPRLLWNAAACEAKRFRYGKAMALVHRYLDSGSPLITPKDIERAKAFLKAAEPMTVALHVKSNEPGAQAYLDGEPLGATPLRSGTRVDPGSHEIVVKKEGFTDYSERVMIGSADRTVNAELSPIEREGRLVVRAGTGDAIMLDGRFVGMGTWQGSVPSGPHTLRVTAPDKRPFESQLVSRDGETRTVEVTLDPAVDSAGLPSWLWIAGGAVLAAGAATAGYFLFKPSEEPPGPKGSIATVELPLR